MGLLLEPLTGRAVCSSRLLNFRAPSSLDPVPATYRLNSLKLGPTVHEERGETAATGQLAEYDRPYECKWMRQSTRKCRERSQAIRCGKETCPEDIVLKAVSSIQGQYKELHPRYKVLVSLLHAARTTQSLGAIDGPLVDSLMNAARGREPPELIPTKTSRTAVQQGSLRPTGLPSLAPNQDQCLLSENALQPQAGQQCAGKYHNPIATTIHGPWGVLPTPRAFIRREGTVLKAGSSTYRPVGPNIYWLGLDENEGQRISYPSRTRVREAFAIVRSLGLIVEQAAAMGANTVRSISMGVSVGHPLSVWPVKGETNEDAFESIDYAVGTARQYGISSALPCSTCGFAPIFSTTRQIDHSSHRQLSVGIPCLDDAESDLLLLGKYTFLKWEGINTTDSDAESNFYRNENVIESFKNYIEVILTHVNQYTGIAYRDDPTILAWETGNELGAFDLEEGAPPASWTNSIARYIKSIDRNHLVVDGSDGVFDSDGDDIEGLDVDAVDVISDHLYPPDNFTFWQDYGLAMAAEKVLLIGEYDWTGSNGGLTLSTFYNQVIKTNSVGDIAWNVMSHDDQCCNYITHDDGYSIYYPNGNASILQKRLLRLVQHWYHLTGRNSPHVLPAVTCEPSARMVETSMRGRRNKKTRSKQGADRIVRLDDSGDF
ncbi:uncharacterized protein VP01_1404g2 [Puccinia sorghi]|uniref:mannan endo-1,4-beta-mannosidase n=1 Tax=Puccinia sorghi TaxID=27349 RepID=A0A0L6VKW7_9BASI|nr:uncharacterized protein VP01_1404g2 [Puccinia sorghi]